MKNGKPDVYDLFFSDEQMNELKKCLECPLKDCSVYNCPYDFFSTRKRQSEGKTLREKKQNYYWKNREKILGKQKEIRDRRKAEKLKGV